MKRFLTIGLVVMVLARSAAASGAPGEDVSVDSWVYDALFELSASHDIPALLLHTRPLSRGAIVDAIKIIRADQMSRSQAECILISRLEAEFREELDDALPAEHSTRLGGGPTAQSDQFRHGVARNRIGFDAIGSFTVGNALTTRLRVRFDSDGRNDSQFHGKYWKEKFTAWVEQAVTVARWKRFTAAFGREYWRWSPSPNDAMLISDHSPPFDGLRLSYRARNWSYSFHATQLDRLVVSRYDYPNAEGPEGLTNRYLVAHRLNWRARPNLEVAASEVLLFGGFDRQWQWNYLNPFLPYYWEQLNDNTDDNPLWNFEVSWRVTEGLKLYGEWMLDDFQIDFHSEPQQIGVLLGGVWIPRPLDQRLLLNAEYERINTFVYGQGRPWKRYFHDRDVDGNVIGIGSNLGTDADRLTIAPIYHLSQILDITGRMDYIRRGENEISDPQNSGVPKGIPFPSGTVEKQLRIGAGGRINVRGQVVASATLGYYQLMNVAHELGRELDGLYVQCKLNVLVWKTFGV